MMRRVQTVALDLYDEHGYNDVSIEHIADDSEVSISSIYRHFGSKEGILLWNPHRESATEQFLNRHTDESPLSELRRITREMLIGDSTGADEWHSRRLGYLLDEPALLEAVGGRLVTAVEFTATTLARRTGRATSDAEIQVTAGALVGALFGALRSWHSADEPRALATVLDEALSSIQRGFPLLTDDRG